jgi:hypothetical protein
VLSHILHMLLGPGRGASEGACLPAAVVVAGAGGEMLRVGVEVVVSVGL